jgi:hypothetical protein
MKLPLAQPRTEITGQKLLFPSEVRTVKMPQNLPFPRRKNGDPKAALVDA